ARANGATTRRGQRPRVGRSVTRGPSRSRSREIAAPGTSPDLTPILGANRGRLRTRRGLSLERLARASGVSRAMLGQVELGKSTPTINVVWKIARALGVSFSTLIADASAR